MHGPIGHFIVATTHGRFDESPKTAKETRSLKERRQSSSRVSNTRCSWPREQNWITGGRSSIQIALIKRDNYSTPPRAPAEGANPTMAEQLNRVDGLLFRATASSSSSISSSQDPQRVFNSITDRPFLNCRNHSLGLCDGQLLDWLAWPGCLLIFQLLCDVSSRSAPQ